MNELSKVLDEIRAMIAKSKGKNWNEENTKVTLINPVLCALGWPVGNPDEVSFEFKLKSSDNPVDYALLIVGRITPILVVEAKALGQNLEGWADKIMGYAGTCGATWVVITNGDEYRIYNATVPVPFEQKLFRKVSLTDANHNATEKTLALLSKGQIDDLAAEWQIHFADSQVLDAIEKLFSPVLDPMFLTCVRKHVKNLTPKHLTVSEVKASLSRLQPEFTFLPVKRPPSPPYREFWEPIQREGLFKGKPADGSWIYKGIRRISLALGVLAHECRVELTFDGEKRQERRDEALKLFPAVRYPHKLHELPGKWLSVRFHVLDKGIKDRDNWPEIQKKLTQLGTEIYNKLKDSDV